jgi:hypothetical protein
MEITVIRDVKHPDGHMVPLIDVRDLIPYLQSAQKTEPILALQSTAALGHVADLVEVKTLEGREAIQRPDSWVCKGSHGDAWVQGDDEIVAGYTYAGMEKPTNGRKPIWLTFVPRTDDTKMSGEWGENEEEDHDGVFPDTDKNRFLLFSPGPSAYVVTRQIDQMEEQTDWWPVAEDIYESDYA